MALSLQADFSPGATLPKTNVYVGCGGNNASPALHWTGAPPKTHSFALTVFDPDAPGGGFWHWIAYGIPATTHALPANSGARVSVATGKFGKNDFGHARYDGPCPPPGPAHRYIFTLYALDADVGIPNGTSVERALKGHVLARAEITGRYGR
jgi:Raf kinase inhibitor-like YbhB/YbcL family protein